MQYLSPTTCNANYSFTLSIHGKNLLLTFMSAPSHYCQRATWPVRCHWKPGPEGTTKRHAQLTAWTWNYKLGSLIDCLPVHKHTLLNRKSTLASMAFLKCFMGWRCFFHNDRPSLDNKPPQLTIPSQTTIQVLTKSLKLNVTGCIRCCYTTQHTFVETPMVTAVGVANAGAGAENRGASESSLATSKPSALLSDIFHCTACIAWTPVLVFFVIKKYSPEFLCMNYEQKKKLDPK